MATCELALSRSRRNDSEAADDVAAERSAEEALEEGGARKCDRPR